MNAKRGTQGDARVNEITYLSAILNTINTAPGVWMHIINKLNDPTVLACHVR